VIDYYAPGLLPEPTYEVVKTDVQGLGYVGPMTLFYCYYYIDQAGINGPERYMRIAIPEGQHVVVLAGMPSGYSDAMSHVELWVNYTTLDDPLFQTKWKWVGKIEHDTLGVFVDKGIYETKHKPLYRPNRQEYRGGVRWSEPYQPDFIKYDSFIEVRSGDGKHITGLDKIYGNLIIFKEDSIHRTTLQNADPPLSRWDEVTAEYGCIAPNTLINVDNTLYFLSWKGLCKYDNNQLTKIDGKFAEELQYVIQTNKDTIRDASCGYNPYYNELYLNVPIKFNQEYISQVTEWVPNPDFGLELEPEFIQVTRNVIDKEQLKRIYEKENIFFDERRFLFSHIFVIKLDLGIAYKFGYQPILGSPDDAEFDYLKYATQPNSLIRLYYNNSLGEMRSADILPSQYGDNITHGGIYIETPYEIGGQSFKDTDSIINGHYYATNPSDDDLYRNTFPSVFEMATRSSYKSKYFTGEDETQIKRLREVVMNLYSKGIIVIDLRYFNYDSIDNRINEINQLPLEFGPEAKIDRYMFNPTVNRQAGTYAENLNVSAIIGTNNNVLHIIPNSNFEESLENLKKIFDINGKPIKFALDIFTEYRTQLNELSYYWRPIHGYLS